MPSLVFALTEPACKTTSPIWQTSLVQLIRINATWMTTSGRTWQSRTNSTIQSFQNKTITAQDRKHRRLFAAKHSNTELQTVSKTDNITKMTILLAAQYNLCLLFTDKSQDKNDVLGQIDYRDWQMRKKLHWRLQLMQMGTLVSVNGGFLPYKSKRNKRYFEQWIKFRANPQKKQSPMFTTLTLWIKLLFSSWISAIPLKALVKIPISSDSLFLFLQRLIANILKQQ